VNSFDDIPSAHEGDHFRDPAPTRERESLGWMVCDAITAVMLVLACLLIAVGV
jgi:hypothetical protein